MYIDKNLIDTIRKKIKISEIIGCFLDLKKRGQNYLCLCPFHDDKHASLTINDNKNIFKCFSCGVSGDAFTFISKYKNISYYESILIAAEIVQLDQKYINAIKTFNNEFNKLDVFYKINYFTNFFFKKFLQTPDGKEAKQYLINRKFNDDLIKEFEIGFAPNNNIIFDLLTNKNNMASNKTNFNYYEIEQLGLVYKNKEDINFFFKNRITFPIYDENNNIVGFSCRVINNDDEPKYLNTNENIIFHKGEILYNLNQVIKDIETKILYIVEGFMDAIALKRMGINNVVATMGTAITNKHLALIKSRLPNLEVVILGFDNDEAGNKGKENAYNLLNNEYSIYLIDFINTEYKDIDEILNADEELAFKNVNNLVSYETYQINKLLAKYPTLNETNKLLILKVATKILHNSKNEITIIENAKRLSELLNIDQNLFLKQSLNKTDNKQKYKKYHYNFDVEINEIKNKKLKGSTIDELEKIIIQFILNDNKVLEYFERGRFNINENEKILNALIEFYNKNPNKTSITIKDLNNIFDDEKTIGDLAQLIIDIENKKEKITQEIAMQTIEQYIKKIREEWNKNVEKKLYNNVANNDVLNQAIAKNKKKH